MEQSRFRDKAYLVTYELTTDIFDAFNLIVDDIVPIRSVYMIFTNSGTKILKKVNYSLDELEFVHRVLEYVGANGFTNMIGFLNSRDGKYYINRDDGIYVILNLLDGREADFKDPLDIAAVSRTVCSFHKAASGITPVPERRNNLYKWVHTFERRALELLKFKEIAEIHEIKTGFDSMFLNYVDEYYNDAVKSVDMLKSSDYLKLCDRVSEKGVICHHDLDYHNIIIGSDGLVYFLDFDSCILDLRIHDIGNLIIKCVKNCGWNIGTAKNIIDSYCDVDMLEQNELEALYGFLVFPQDFYDISRSYYMKTKNWDEDDFLVRLQAKSGCYKDRMEFLDKFKDIMLKGAV